LAICALTSGTTDHDHRVPPRGRQNQKSVTPVVGWWVRVQKRGGVRFVFFDIFLVVFLNSPHRETPKNVIKENQEQIGFGFLVEFFGKFFRHDVFCMTSFFSAFQLPSLRNTRKREKTKKKSRKTCMSVSMFLWCF
jgi:hypothetical protein